jgi:FdhE protein
MAQEEKDLKDLYQELEKAKAKAQEQYKDEKIEIDLAELEKKASQSQHLIDFKNIQVDEEWLEGFFKKFLSILKRFRKENGKVVEKLKQGFEKKDLNLESLIKKVFTFDTSYLDALAEKLGLEVDDLYFLGLQAGNPIFELYAGKVKERIDADNWSKGFCPVCGSSPAMAYLREDDGKRILWCQFCSTQWCFLRLKCPFCSNEDQKTLKYFFTDENDPYRVHLCDKCKKYLKTIDQRKMKNPENLDLGWENLHSFAMDLVAQKEGFVGPHSQISGKNRGVII